MIGRKGCVRSALECCKLLLSLDERDPQGALFQLDFFALRAGQLEWLLAFLPQRKGGGAMSMPSAVYSYALAALFLRQAVDGGERNDPEQLERARAALAETTGVEGTMRHALLLHPAARALLPFPPCAPPSLAQPRPRPASDRAPPHPPHCLLSAISLVSLPARCSRSSWSASLPPTPCPSTPSGGASWTTSSSRRGPPAHAPGDGLLAAARMVSSARPGESGDEAPVSRSITDVSPWAALLPQNATCNDSASLEQLVDIFVERHHSLYRPAAVCSHLKRCAAAAAAEADGAAPAGPGTVRDWAAVREEVFQASDHNSCAAPVFLPAAPSRARTFRLALTWRRAKALSTQRHPLRSRAARSYSHLTVASFGDASARALPPDENPFLQQRAPAPVPGLPGGAPGDLRALQARRLLASSLGPASAFGARARLEPADADADLPFILSRPPSPTGDGEGPPRSGAGAASGGARRHPAGPSAHPPDP